MSDSEQQAVWHAPDLITNHIFFLNRKNPKKNNVYMYILFIYNSLYIFSKLKGKNSVSFIHYIHILNIEKYIYI